jgi:hypothetical protein
MSWRVTVAMSRKIARSGENTESLATLAGQSMLPAEELSYGRFSALQRRRWEVTY